MTDFNLTDRDADLLSAYLDDELTTDERATLEARLQTDAALRRELDLLRQTVTLIRNMPTLQAPRNFTLTPEMLAPDEQSGSTGQSAVQPITETKITPLPQRKTTLAPYTWAGLAAALVVVVFGLAFVLSQNGFNPQQMPSSNNIAAAPTSPSWTTPSPSVVNQMADRVDGDTQADEPQEMQASPAQIQTSTAELTTGGTTGSDVSADGISAVGALDDDVGAMVAEESALSEMADEAQTRSMDVMPPTTARGFLPAPTSLPQAEAYLDETMTGAIESDAAREIAVTDTAPLAGMGAASAIEAEAAEDAAETVTDLTAPALSVPVQPQPTIAMVIPLMTTTSDRDTQQTADEPSASTFQMAPPAPEAQAMRQPGIPVDVSRLAWLGVQMARSITDEARWLLLQRGFAIGLDVLEAAFAIQQNDSAP